MTLIKSSQTKNNFVFNWIIIIMPMKIIFHDFRVFDKTAYRNFDFLDQHTKK